MCHTTAISTVTDIPPLWYYSRAGTFLGLKSFPWSLIHSLAPVVEMY